MSKKRKQCIIVEDINDEGGHTWEHSEELEKQTSLQVRTKETAEIRQSEGNADEEEEKYFEPLHICAMNKIKMLKHLLFLLFTLNLIAYLLSLTRKLKAIFFKRIKN